MTIKESYQPVEQSTRPTLKSNRQNLAASLFWVGLLISVAFAGIAGWNLTHNLRTLSATEIETTVWNIGGPMFSLWAFSVTLGSVLAIIGAFLYVKTKPFIAWFTGIGVLGVVIAMTVVWSTEYYPPLFGVGGTLILGFFFAIVWLWMKRYARLDIQGKIAGSYTLIGYLFWMNASWFLCGETSKLHLKAFAGSAVPSPIEIMVFLLLGWFFVLVGEYKLKQQ